MLFYDKDNRWYVRYMNPNPLTIFGRVNSNNIFSGAYIKISEVRIKKSNGDIQKKYVPCKQNSDNTLWMCEIIGGNFFTNAGTGTFTAGPVVQ